MKRAPVTAYELRALRFLAGVRWATPSSIGEALHDGVRSAQGYGRLGGRIATRLRDKGLTRLHVERYRGKLWPLGYEITVAGRETLKGEKDG